MLAFSYGDFSEEDWNKESENLGIGHEELYMSLKDLYFLISSFWFGAEGIDGAVKEFNIGLGVCKMIYVKNGNEKYRKILSDMFKTPDAYDEWDSDDFVLFSLNGDFITAGTYSQLGLTMQIDDFEDFFDTLIWSMKAIKNDG